MNKKWFILIAIFFITSAGLTAQELPVVSEETTRFFDFRTSLRDFVYTSDSLDIAMEKYVERNKYRTVDGYRLRIFFDNRQNARVVSEKILLEFLAHYPEVPIFRVYDNPYWRVTVGSFRTKSEANKFKNEITKFYPSVFLVREAFSTI